MISQAALKLGRRCRRLSGFARSAGRRVAAASSERFLPLRTSPQGTEGGGEFLDLHDYQVCLGDAVDQRRTVAQWLRNRWAITGAGGAARGRCYNKADPWPDFDTPPSLAVGNRRWHR